MNILIVFFLVIYVVYEVYSRVRKTESWLIFLFFLLFTGIHFGISIVSFYFLDQYNLSIDSVRFYDNALQTKHWFELFNLGSSFISFLIYPFVQLKISIEVLFLLFATISFKGFLILFDMAEIKDSKNYNKVFLFFFLLPSIHYWTGMLGKEALLMLLMALLLKGIKFKWFHFRLLIIGAFIFLIRPPLFFVLVLSYWTFFLMDKEVQVRNKIKSVFGMLLLMIVLVPITVVFFLKINELNLNSLNVFVLQLIDYSRNNGRSLIDLDTTNVITRIGYLLFMPLPFLYEIKNKIQLIASVENVGFLLGIIYAFIYLFKNKIRFREFGYEMKFVLITILFTTIFFGSYLYNLGLGNRMRVMILPFVFYFFVKVPSLLDKKVKK